MKKIKSAWFTPTRVVLGALVVAAAAWGVKKVFFAEPTKPDVITATVTVGDMEDTVLASGTIKSFKDVSVGAQVSGQIKRLHVALGDRVQKGQLVAEIDSTTQQNAYQNAQAQIALLQAQLLAKQATLTQAELSFKRKKSLLAQDAGSAVDFEDAQAGLATAKADIAVLHAQIQQAKTSLDTARVNLDYTRITAPIDGVVVAVLAEQGRTVNANQSAPTIIKLSKLDTVQIKAQISEADVVRVKPGLPVYFTILGEPNKRYEAQLKSIEPVPDSSQTDTNTSATSTSTSATAIYYNGLFEVPNPDGKLRVAMTAQVFIVLAKAKDALLIPATALSDKAVKGEYTVRVLEGEEGDQKVVPRKVKVGLNNRVQAQVLSGLKAGDKVVVGEGGPAGSGSSGGGRRSGALF
ncbi:efflux RND transporter periplasmic adaptor subunit [Aquabacterium sp.]|uniref:efflux RND transporter periplasmic adaptor subunit n=1 Tax=Aquabacterium sp. TaxID=1872578 RepID=UPI0024886A7F|nr:efflux RND transporter periplasmic adaptor subunit [Aquabacterium sp.]MDI1261199.1 efflux RND transporter periplasmic adaptor subunit [Aquabacterium sp.]